MNIEKIWSAYRNSLKAFLHSKIANAADVDDLLQEIMIKTYNNLAHLQKSESIKPWIFQIANRTIIDFYRKKESPNTLSSEELWYASGDYDVKGELSRCIEPFLQALPEEAADLLRSIDLEGVSQKNYALQEGISYSTLKSRVQKARTELKALFENCCHYHLDTQGNLIDFDRKNNHCKKC